MKNIQSVFLSALFIVFVFSSCKKDTTATPPESTTGTLSLHIHTNADSNEVGNYGDTVVMTSGRKIAVTTAQLYLSNIKLIKTDGSVVDGPSTIVLVKQGTEVYTIGSVTAGNYKSVRFDVGLSDAVNGSTPSSSDVILNQPSMWFSSTAQPDGFVFVNFQGIIDTTDAMTGTDLVPFTYKIGTTWHRITVTMPDQNYTVVPDQQMYIHMTADYAKLFDGVQLNVNSNLSITTVVENWGALATQIADNNISSMFDYEY